MITKDDFIAWFDKLADVYEENREYLTELDSAIGDADHGANMARGFTRVKEKVHSLEYRTLDVLLKDVGMTLVSTVGGSSGPLYGTLFMKAGMAAKDQYEVDLEQFVKMFDEALAGVVHRGKAQLEDKTMIDALSPAIDALKKATGDGASIAEAVQQAAEAAKAGMEATTPLQAKKGRASYLGERSIGHQDPGATSTYLMMQAAADTWKDNE